MYQISNFIDNDNITTLTPLGIFTTLEYQHDLSIMPQDAQITYFANAMNVCKRQVVCDLSKASGGITLQAGTMQWMVGNVDATTGIEGMDDLLGKAMHGKVTGESTIKPEYTGSGTLVLEPTHHHVLLVDLQDWNGSIVLDDGLFLTYGSTLKHKAVMCSSFSSAMAGDEGLFSLGVSDNGILYLESVRPREELVEITLQDDILRVDRNMVITWSGNLNFTVERSGKSLMGSAISGEGLVSIFRGTGKVLLAPVAQGIA